MKKSEGNLFQKLMSGIGFTGSSRVPLRSNVFSHGRGYSPIGVGGNSRIFDADRESPLLGSAQPSNRISGYYDRMGEIRSYFLLDISRLSVTLFKDYLINFLIKDGKEVVTIQNEDGSNNETVSERINNILTKDLKIFDYIENHLDDSIFYGSYTSMLLTSRDQTGHKTYRFEEIFSPTDVVIKRKKNKDGIIEEIYLARGEDGKIYEIAQDEAFFLGSANLRLVNDLEEGWKDKNVYTKPSEKYKLGKSENRDKVMRKESYIAAEPLFYSNILKVKELVIKELLISLLSLRDLSSPSLYGLAIDKAVPIETANELCARVQKMSTNYNELSSFLTAQFDVTSFIESALTQNVKFFPDYNATISNKNSLLPLDKLSDKLLELMQNLDQCRQNVLSPLGIPNTIFDSTTGSKWAILQQSERANSRVASLMSGINNSIQNLAATLYRSLYNEEIDPSNIKTHIFEKSTVEYNNQINQSESINSLVQGISSVITTSLQTLEAASPLLDPEKYLSYIQNLIKSIDPSADSMITEETIQSYIELLNAKLQAQKDQIAMGG